MAAQQQHSSVDTNKIARPRGKNFDTKENELIVDLFAEKKRVAEVETQFNRYNAEEKFGVKEDL